MVRLLATALLLAATALCHAVTPERLYVLPPGACAPCQRLGSYLSGKGVQLIPVCEVPQTTIDAYPRLYYSDKTYDNGQRVYSGACTLPKTLLTVTHKF